MTRLLRALKRRRRPAHIGWGGDYTGSLTFLAIWEPNPKGEIR